MKSKMDLWSSQLAWAALVEGVLALVTVAAVLSSDWGAKLIVVYLCMAVNFSGMAVVKSLMLFEVMPPEVSGVAWLVMFVVSWLFWGLIVWLFRVLAAAGER